LGWTVPDQVVVPVASGALLCAIHRGFAELEQVGLVEEASVKFNAAQPEGFPVARAIKEHTKVEPIRSWSTLVHSLAIGNPADGTFAKKVVEQSGGYAEDPSDLEAIEAIKLLASTEGVFTELAGGITIAALKRLVDGGRIDEDEVVVAYLTGNGLKTPEALVPHLSEPIRIDGRIEEVEEVISCCA
ncbi:MAG: Threonine synthase, partial [Methanosarcinales archeaon 56_1174]